MLEQRILVFLTRGEGQLWNCMARVYVGIQVVRYNWRWDVQRIYRRGSWREARIQTTDFASHGNNCFFWSCIQEIKPLLPSLLISLLLPQEKALSQSMCNKHRRGRQTVQCPLRLSFSIGRKFSGTIDNELFWLLGWWKIYSSPWKWPVVRENEGSSDLRKRMKRLGMSGVAGSSDNNLLTCLKLKLKL